VCAHGTQKRPTFVLSTHQTRPSMQPTTSTNAPNPQLKYTFKTLERIPVKIWQSPEAASRHVAQSIALAIR